MRSLCSIYDLLYLHSPIDFYCKTNAAQLLFLHGGLYFYADASIRPHTFNQLLQRVAMC